MSRDVAKIIYDMASKDYDLVTDLKMVYKRTNMYKDLNKLLRKVYQIVRCTIKNHSTYISLKYGYEISGSKIVNYTKYSGIDQFKLNECDKKYAFTENNDIIVVNDENTRQLIDDVIIPLDLRWYAKRWSNSNFDEYHVYVSWDHW